MIMIENKAEALAGTDVQKLPKVRIGLLNPKYFIFLVSNWEVLLRMRTRGTRIILGWGRRSGPWHVELVLKLHQLANDQEACMLMEIWNVPSYRWQKIQAHKILSMWTTSPVANFC